MSTVNLSGTVIVPVGGGVAYIFPNVTEYSTVMGIGVFVPVLPTGPLRSSGYLGYDPTLAQDLSIGEYRAPTISETTSHAN